MITIQHTKEELSMAYIQAVAAKAGQNLIVGRRHDYGYDGTIKHIIKDGFRHIESGFGFDFQAKATCDWSLEAGEVVYDLEAKTYNDFVTRANRNGALPSILIVMCLCASESDWLTVSCDQMVLKNCAYWLNLKGDVTTNKATKRIRIPAQNVFTPENMVTLLERIEAGEDL
jgi:hypothetical protein